MRNVIIYFVLLIVIVLNVACEEDFSPVDDTFIEKHVFNCVLNSADSIQIAKLYLNYLPNPDGSVPDSSGEIIKNALIRVWYEDEVVFFTFANEYVRDQVVYKNIYYAEHFTPKPNTVYEVEVLFPDGKRLKSTTTSPALLRFPTGNLTIPMKDQFDRSMDNIYIPWSTGNTNYYVSSRFIILYKNDQIGPGVHKFIVPHEYVESDGKILPYYPVPSYEKGISISQNTFDQALKELSGNDPDKSSYVIYSFLLETISFDSHLSSYYASVNSKKEDYAIILNQRTYTNIDVGLGIFGSHTKQKKSILFEPKYILSFGYEYGLGWTDL